MSGKLTLDSFVTTLACLASYSDGPLPTTPKDALMVNNTTMGCSPQAISTLNTQVRTLRDTDDSLILQMSQLKRSVDAVNKKLSTLETKGSDNVPSCIGQRPGYALIAIPRLDSVLVFCENNVDKFGDNWLLFARRNDGGTDFYVGWDDYKEGFGGLSQDFFLGMEKLHAITTLAIHELLIILSLRTGETVHAHYDYFSIGSESEKYSLKLLSGYSGDAGDALSYHSGNKFSTYDRDNDMNKVESCARKHVGAWWYKDCMESNLFGAFAAFDQRIKANKGILWKGFLDGPDGSIKVVKMYVRPREAK